MFLNGEQITEPTQIFSGDILRCSTHMLKFADMSEDRRAVQEQRRTIAGRNVSAGGTLFFLTVFELLLALERCYSETQQYKQAYECAAAQREL